jgi:hypothetical protein
MQMVCLRYVIVVVQEGEGMDKDFGGMALG